MVDTERCTVPPLAGARRIGAGNGRLPRLRLLPPHRRLDRTAGFRRVAALSELSRQVAAPRRCRPGPVARSSWCGSAGRGGPRGRRGRSPLVVASWWRARSGRQRGRRAC